MSVMRIAKIIMPLLLLAMLNCRPAAAEISVDGDWGKARFYVFRLDARTAASTLQYRQGQHKAVFQSAVGMVKKFKKYGRLFLEYTDYGADAARLKGRQDDLTAGLRIDF